MKTKKGRKMLTGLLSCAVACSLVCGAAHVTAADVGEVWEMPEDVAAFPQLEDVVEEDVVEEDEDDIDEDDAETGGTTEDGLQWIVLEDGTAEIKAYNGVAGEVVIPKTIEGYSVARIGSWAFSSRSSLTSVIIPTGVTSIGENAFSDCSGLKSVIIPDSVTSIEYEAFFSCSGLKSVIIPDGVTDIGENAFSDCSGLTSITIPASVTSIGEAAFSDCSGLEMIEVKEGNTVYDSRDNCNAIIKGSKLIAGCKNTVIPADVVSIGESAFSSCSGLTSVTIPASVTSIGRNAFSSCSCLKSVTIPAGVTSIERYAFKGCSGLEMIEVEEGNTVYDSRDNCNAIIRGSELIAGCKNTVIPNDVTEIGMAAFSDCIGLTSITIPDSVTRIGYSAFGGCSGLESVTIPDSVTEIDSSAFWECIGLKSVAIPAGVSDIGDGAFYGCVGLTSVTLPVGVKRIFYKAFKGCVSLTSITLPAGVTDIWDDAFSGCSGLTSAAIPDSVTRIGYSAFRGCSGLTSVTIPAGATDIEYNAFNGCSGLERIEVKEGNTVYDSRDNCNALIQGNKLIAGCKNTVIPDSVTSIGNDAFYGCTGLTSVTIPAGVTDIGIDAFWGCSGLERIEVKEGNTVYDSRDNCNAIIKGSELIAGCKNTIIPDSVTSIGWGAFSGRSGLASVTIPTGVTSIEWYAFKGCSGLTSVTIPDGVTDIGYGAFSGCSGLKSVTLPGSVAGIEGETFLGCSGLTSVTIPTSVTSIGYDVFKGCSSLKSVIIPDSVTSIKSGVFKDCGDNLIIYGVKGSTAEQYAIGSKIPFKEITEYPGSGAHTHAYGSPSFTWSPDFATCAAIFSCADGDDTTKPQTASVTSAVTTEATCAAEGVKTYTAKLVFGGQEYTDTKTQTLAKLTSHTEDAGIVTTEATCTAEGVKTYTCLVCKAVTRTESMLKLDHDYGKKTVRATDKENGSISDVCKVCGDIQNEKIINKIGKTSLSASRYTYDGKAKKPSVTVADVAGAKLTNGTDYSVSYKDNKKAGIATATITLKGNYEGTITETFEIAPKATAISKLSAAKKGFKVTWKKQAAETSGYEIAYSTSSKFTAKTTKTATVSKKTTSKSVTKLAARKKYYVKIRTYKTVKADGKSQKVYSDWSKVKSITTKK